MAARRAAITCVGGVNRHCPVFCMYCHWSRRSRASEELLPAERSARAPGDHEAHARHALQAFPDAAISASKRMVRASIGMAP